MRKEDAILNTPNESIVALKANHRDLIKFTGPDDPSYRVVRNFLRSIERGVRDNLAVSAPPPRRAPTPPSQGHVEGPQRIDFNAYVTGVRPRGLGREVSCSASDLQNKSLDEVLRTASPIEGADQGPFQLTWAHIPLTNTAWVNVRPPPPPSPPGPLAIFPHLPLSITYLSMMANQRYP